jgi:hypothetical protein
MKIQQFTTLKNILIALLLCISASQSIAQNSNGIFFQAVARDNFSNPAKDRNIYVESSILQTTVNGTKVLVELHKTRTDAMGVFNITIGNGQRTGGSSTSIATIDWSKGPFYLNLKIAITPFSASDSWDYSKELVDIGTTSFGAVPFAFYSASSAKVSDKLDATDTTKMLAVYAKAMAVQSLATDVSTKLTAADTLTMLAPYAKAAYTIDSNFFRSQLATKLNIVDTINYTKQKYTDSAFSKKLNIADSSSYVTPSKLTANLFDQTPLKNEIATKLNIADSSSYVTPSKLAIYYTSSASSGTTVDTSSLSNRINLKASSSDVTNAIALNTSAITTNTNAITANTSAIASEATTARAAELGLTNSVSSNTTNISSNTASITANTASISNLNSNIASNTSSITANSAEIITNRANIATNTTAITANANAIATNTTAITANTSTINTNTTAIAAETTTARAAELALTNSVSSNTTNISSNTASITANTTSIDNLNSNIASNSSSITANTSDIITNRINIATNTSAITANVNAITTNTTAIAAEATTARAAELVLTNDINSNTATITSNTSAIAANTASILINSTDIELRAPIISPTFTGTPTAPTAAAGINTTQLATTAFVNNATSNINASSISGTVALSQGGTGQTTIAGLKSVLGLASSKVAIGADAGLTTQSSGASAFGGGAGQTNQGAYSVAIGYVAGQSNQGTLSVAVGNNAAQSAQGSQSVAIGYAAGQNSQGANAVAIGGYSTSSFINSIAIGYKATTTAANTIQLGGDGVVSGSTAITNVKTTGTLTAGTVTYPNAHNSTAGQLLSINATGTAAWTTPASSGGGTHAIGEVYGGGIVFYVWDGGAHGLIGANTELNNGQATSWGGGSSAYVGTQNRYGVLGGKLNTQRILNVIPVPTFGNGDNGTGNKSAAYWAATYLSAAVVVGGVTVTPQFSDWYLPNETELMLFATQRSYFPNCNFTTHDHWSSSERPDYAYLAYALGANSNTNIYQDAKTATKYVLAIRSF